MIEREPVIEKLRKPFSQEKKFLAPIFGKHKQSLSADILGTVGRTAIRKIFLERYDNPLQDFVC